MIRRGRGSRGETGCQGEVLDRGVLVRWLARDTETGSPHPPPFLGLVPLSGPDAPELGLGHIQ